MLDEAKCINASAEDTGVWIGASASGENAEQLAGIASVENSDTFGRSRRTA